MVLRVRCGLGCNMCDTDELSRILESYVRSANFPYRTSAYYLQIKVALLRAC